MAEWTKEPPKKSGHYWMRDRKRLEVVEVAYASRPGRRGTICFWDTRRLYPQWTELHRTAYAQRRLWWSTPIEPPKEERRA